FCGLVAALSDDRRQAATAVLAGRERAAGAVEQAAGQGDRGAAVARQDPDLGTGPGAAVAARLLFAGATEGDPEGAGRAGRRPARHRGAAPEDRSRGHAGRGEEGGPEGAGAAVAHVSDGGRLRADTQLHRVAG